MPTSPRKRNRTVCSVELTKILRLLGVHRVSRDGTDSRDRKSRCCREFKRTSGYLAKDNELLKIGTTDKNRVLQVYVTGLSDLG